MQQALIVVGIALVLFVSTNIDDIFILISFFADPDYRPAQVLSGQLTGMLALIVVSIAGSLVALVIAPAYVGLLGVVPLGLGIAKLVPLLRGEMDEPEVPHPGSSSRRIVTVGLVTFANGGDNIGVYVPVFAQRSAGELAIMTVTFLVMTAAWCALAYYLVSHPRVGAPIRRYAPPITPFVLIALGLYILIESKAYALLAHWLV